MLQVSRSVAGIKIETDNFTSGLARVLDFIAARGVRVVSVHTARTTLEDVFIALTGHALRDGPPAT